VAGAGIVLGVLALEARRHARRAERRNPPQGRFLRIEGVKLHYVDVGEGPAVVFLHGNGSLLADFEASGLLDLASHHYRAIAFDRPGFGHSSRPRDRAWTPREQARLLDAALQQLGVEQAVVVGHSWGSLVALALALEFPERVTGLVLASGYYFPTARIDAPLAALPAVPVVGDVLSHTVSPALARLAQSVILRKLFDPAPVPRHFDEFPMEMATRPSQIRATAAEAGLLQASAAELARHYSDLETPTIILAGIGDRIVDTRGQSIRLHNLLPDSDLRLAPRVGHMLHQTAPGLVMEAIHRLVGPETRTLRNLH
jgi:pimeloyl-ACP methyl ester carboxylesterase